jgi:hypothetical protein
MAPEASLTVPTIDAWRDGSGDDEERDQDTDRPQTLSMVILRL